MRKLHTRIHRRRATRCRQRRCFLPSRRATTPASTPALANEQLLLQVHAKGDQIYTCKSDAAQFTWTLKAPDAQLFDKDGKPFGKHFAGPSWEANDGSPCYRQSRCQYGFARRLIRFLGFSSTSSATMAAACSPRNNHPASQHQRRQSTGDRLRRFTPRPGTRSILRRLPLHLHAEVILRLSVENT